MINKNYKKWLCGLMVLLLLLLSGCVSEPNEDIVTEDTQLYILFTHNKDTKKIFVESVETGHQKEFTYDTVPAIIDRTKNIIGMDQLQAGELLQLVYTGDNKLTEIRIAADIFVLDNITDFAIDTAKKTITVEGTQYTYNVRLKIFAGKKLVPVNRMDEVTSICVRGQGEQIVTMIVSGIEE